MSNRGIGRARQFVGSFLLLAAAITWATAFLMSPHAPSPGAEAAEHVRAPIVIFVRNSAIGTLILCALCGWLLFPSRRPKKPRRDWIIAILIGLMVASSLYELVWLQFFVSR